MVLCSRYQGHVGSSLIVGGTDVTGAHLYSVYPHGSYDKLPYLSMGKRSWVYHIAAFRRHNLNTAHKGHGIRGQRSWGILNEANFDTVDGQR